MRATKVSDSTVADLRRQVRRRTRTDRGRRDNFGRGFAPRTASARCSCGLGDIVIAMFHRIVRFGQRQILKRQAPLRRIQKPDSDSPSRKRRAVHHKSLNAEIPFWHLATQFENRANNLLGFTLISGKSRVGKFPIQRARRSDRVWSKLMEIRDELRRRMHQSIPVRASGWDRSCGGWFNDHAVPTNSPALSAFRFHVTDLWRRKLQTFFCPFSTAFKELAAPAQGWGTFGVPESSRRRRCARLPGELVTL